MGYLKFGEQGVQRIIPKLASRNSVQGWGLGPIETQIWTIAAIY